ncbi:MAG: hypothetical protein AB1733_15840 [Thermodesulfobacteriota bacterium]
MLEPREISLDGTTYRVEVLKKHSQPPEAPRLVIVSHLTGSAAEDILKVCVRAVEFFTPEKYELWVVDNNSPRERTEWLLRRPGLNVILNRTEPLPPEARAPDSGALLGAGQRQWGSYANAVGLELAARIVDPETRYFMTMHMDVMPCREGWLSFLLSKMVPGVAAAGARMDRTRTPEGVLHVLGFIVDFHIFTALGLDFFPELPALDVGDRVTVELRRAGYGVHACPNTIWEPELASSIAPGSPLKNLQVDRAFDDEGNVIFLHLGRGLRKSDGEYTRGVTVDGWMRIADEIFRSSRTAHGG